MSENKKQELIDVINNRIKIRENQIKVLNQIKDGLPSVVTDEVAYVIKIGLNNILH